MKLRLEATPEEIESKAPRLVAALSKALRAHAPDVADQLLKAIPEKESPLKHQVLRDIHGKISNRYAITLDMMVEEIGKRLEDHVSEMKKSNGTETNPNYATNILDLEAKAYEVAKEELAKFGYDKTAFEVGGALYGESVNSLREMLAQLKESA
jgi:hypothetical protein